MPSLILWKPNQRALAAVARTAIWGAPIIRPASHTPKLRLRQIAKRITPRLRIFPEMKHPPALRFQAHTRPLMPYVGGDRQHGCSTREPLVQQIAVRLPVLQELHQIFHNFKHALSSLVFELPPVSQRPLTFSVLLGRPSSRPAARRHAETCHG